MFGDRKDVRSMMNQMPIKRGMPVLFAVCSDQHVYSQRFDQLATLVLN